MKYKCDTTKNCQGYERKVNIKKGKNAVCKTMASKLKL